MQSSPQKKRLSNMELLRIISMFCVLIVHSDFGALNTPTKEELTLSPIYCIIRTFLEAFALVAVNVFVLLSGWFSITFKWKGICNLLFQCFFFTFIYAVCILAGIDKFSMYGIRKCLMLSENLWFVKCYLGLYILAPALNIFIEKANKKTIQQVLLCFFIFQSIYDWIAHSTPFIAQGYSSFSFIGLYLLARYIRIYTPKWSNLTAKWDLFMYLFFSIGTAIAMLTFVYLDKFAQFARFMDYSSPLIIAAALFLLLYFSKFQFQSHSINWIAASCFAVYLQHFILFPQIMHHWIIDIAHSHSGISIVFYISGLLILFYTTAILVDKVRLYIWNKILATKFK